MIVAPLHPNEAERLERLNSYCILDTDPDQLFDDLSKLASEICGTPIALVSLVDSTRQWFKSRVGLEATETPRDMAFCSHAILAPGDVFVVEDARQDERFCDNPLVAGPPDVVFYAGAPLVEPSGMPLGTLCVIDNAPRQLTPNQTDALRALARQVVSQLELRRVGLEQRDTANRLAASNRELEDFAHIAAHDLQAPLRRILSFVDLLREDIGHDLPAAAEDDVAFIAQSATNMRDLIRELLRVSRTGTTQLDLEAIDVAQCVGDAIDALSVAIDEARAEVRVDTLPVTRVDRILVGQIFQNLIGNALKFVRESVPEIQVTCSQEEGETVFGVRDNGIGIEPDALVEVFQPFRRLNPPQEFEGTGMGLSIARKAVERHGGRMWVESEPGKGSHFKFVLGKAEQSPSPVLSGAVCERSGAP